MRCANPIISGALLAFSFAACAKSTQPLPNKNTNWLEHCESDDECGEALECRCGICTVTCERDATCEVDDRLALCWHERSDELRDQCDAPSSMAAICVPPERVGMDEVPDDECPTPGSCIEIIAEDSRPTALVIYDERLYWLEAAAPHPESRDYNGALKSARLNGGDAITIVGELSPDYALQVDSSYAYFTHSKGLSRVPLTGGDLEYIYEGYIEGIALDGDRVLFSDHRVRVVDGVPITKGNIAAAPSDGSLYTNELYVPEPAPLIAEGLEEEPIGLAVSERDLFWIDSQAINHLDMAAQGGTAVLARAGASEAFVSSLAHHGDSLFWVTVDAAQRVRLASVDVRNPELAWRTEPIAAFPTQHLAADESHVYWSRVDINSLRISVVRTDRVTLETVPLMELGEGNLLIALSSDYVFVASGPSSFTDEAGEGLIMRFPK
jgi:hypothetical protein